MSKQPKFHLGLSCPPLDFQSIDLGHGAMLTGAYAKVFAHYMLSYTPESPTAKFGEPWKEVDGSSGFIINAQCTFPVVAKSKLSEKEQLDHFSCLLRVAISPEIRCPVIASSPFSSPEEAAKEECKFAAFDVEPIYTPFKNAVTSTITVEKTDWMKTHWHESMIFAGECKPYKLAVSVLGKASNFHSRGMALVSICGILESFYLQNKAELSFRLALYIGAYLGTNAKERQHYFEVAKGVYKARSASAHSSEECDTEPLLQAIHLLRMSLWAALANKKLPKSDDLDRLLLDPNMDFKKAD